MGRKLVLAGGSLVVVALAAAAFFAWQRSNSAASQPPTPQVATADTADLLIPVTVRARDVVPVPAPIEGTVETFYVEVGDEVFEGQALAFIRNTSLESAKEHGYAVLEQAQEKANRLESALIEGRLEASRASAEIAGAASCSWTIGESCSGPGTVPCRIRTIAATIHDAACHGAVRVRLKRPEVMSVARRDRQ